MATCETRKGFAFNNPDTTSNYLAPGWGMLMTADELRYDELFGNPLIAEADSQAITDEQLSDYIRVAIAYVEGRLHIDILPRRIRYDDPIGESGESVTRTDIDDGDFTSTMNRKQLSELYIREPGYAFRVVPARYECRVKLRRRPVRDLLTAKLVDPYYGTEVYDLMPYRIVKKGLTGVCYFRPRQLASRVNTYSNLWQYIFQPYSSTRQGVFLIDYETGYENCVEVPDELRYVIRKLAAVTLMNIYGDGKFAAIASRSVNLNSVSESISTTMSATSAAFGARIIQYQKEIKEWFALNSTRYSRTMIGVL
ncbi:MAG TPA: hypothetical protein PK986_08270 [Spirochaetota bacterium]|mgnify:CR=1 FL=1|nr:hypothetical protein [Spirochaetota bacterium]